MDVQKDVTNTLNDLIETCRDGQNGFKSAADAIEDPSLQTELMGYSDQRRDFATTLQNIVAYLGEEPKESGSAAGAMHRGWINLRGAISKHDPHAILAECERGEDSAVESYRKAIDAGLPSEYDQPIQTQYQDVLRTHDRIKELRDSSAPA